jgi:hypothetical protein
LNRKRLSSWQRTANERPESCPQLEDLGDQIVHQRT